MLALVQHPLKCAFSGFSCRWSKKFRKSIVRRALKWALLSSRFWKHDLDLPSPRFSGGLCLWRNRLPGRLPDRCLGQTQNTAGNLDPGAGDNRRVFLLGTGRGESSAPFLCDLPPPIDRRCYRPNSDGSDSSDSLRQLLPQTVDKKDGLVNSERFERPTLRFVV